jgi:hypothetical protein
MPLSHTQVHEGRREAFLPGSHERRIQLATGDLEITINRADLDLEDLCDFAARQNPKRGFLFVSKILGRHLPARPSIMRDVHRRLAEKIPTDLPGPVVIIGLAETATCLGQGVHSHYLTRTHRDDVLFIHTTRHRLGRPKAFDFFEEHSHAAQHSVYVPEATEDRVLFETARSAVLVDDEVSTGGTLANLAKALSGFNTCLEQALCLTLTDWRGAERTQVASGVGIDAFRRALVRTQRPRDLLVMEHLPGPERSIDCLAEEGRLIAAVARVKHESWQELEISGAAVDLAATLTRRYELSGIFNVQTRDARGVPHLLEVNPRMSGGILYACQSGLALPYWAVLLALGLCAPEEVPVPREGMAVASVTSAVIITERRTAELPSSNGTVIGEQR